MKTYIIATCVFAIALSSLVSCKNKSKNQTSSSVEDATPAQAVEYAAHEVVPAFSMNGTSKDIAYKMLDKASKPWNVCVSFPHMKDAYWLGVDYGVSDQAKKLGVKMHLVEAGGYTNLNRQISQIEDCVASGADAVIIGAISADGLNNIIKEISDKGIPVIDLVNGVTSTDIKAKSLVSFYTMGYETGAFLAKQHPKGSEATKVGWFPGPAGAAWVEAAHRGFMDAVKESAIHVLEPKFGDTGKEVQLKLVEDVLQSNPEVKYIAGTAVTAEAAQGLIRERNLLDKVKILAFYMTPGVYSGIKKGYIMAAPADAMVLQGRFAIDQAVRILDGKPYIKHVGPKIVVVNKDNINDIPRSDILPPASYKPEFSVN